MTLALPPSTGLCQLHRGMGFEVVWLQVGSPQIPLPAREVHQEGVRVVLTTWSQFPRDGILGPPCVHILDSCDFGGTRTLSESHRLLASKPRRVTPIGKGEDDRRPVFNPVL